MLLGIDVGTSPVKAMLFDPGRGTSVGLAREPLRLAAPDERQAELDPGHLWEVLCTVLGRLRSGHRRAWDGLRGVGLSVIFPALVPMDAAGNPLRGAILYCDRRSLPQVVRLQHEARAEEVEALTGNRLTPGTTTLPVLLWLREHEAEVFERAACFGQLSTYLVHRLTGEWVLDSTHGSLSGLCRSGLETAWYGPLLDIAGIGPERLPVLQAADTAAGLTGGRAAGECGLRPGIPVAAGSGDAPLAAFTGGAVCPGTVFASAGTTDCIMLAAAAPSGDPVFCNIHGPTPEPLWLVNGTMSSAGAAVHWFCSRFANRDPEAVTDLAAMAPPGSRGVVFLPYLQGERTPWWDPVATGVFFGLDLSCGLAEAARAVFEGIACGWRQIVTRIEESTGVTAESIVSVGGGSTNPLWNRIKATFLDRPIQTLHRTEITSLGAALQGGVAAGIYPSTNAAIRATEPLRTSSVTLPEPAWRQAAEATYGLYDELYPALRHLFGRAAAAAQGSEGRQGTEGT